MLPTRGFSFSFYTPYRNIKVFVQMMRTSFAITDKYHQENLGHAASSLPFFSHEKTVFFKHLACYVTDNVVMH